jgi:GDP-L-fucose synthase
MKILVTGAHGLVGKHLQELLHEGKYWDLAWKDLPFSSPLRPKLIELRKSQWLFPSRKDVDWTNQEQVNTYIQKEKPTHVIHLAARVGGIFRNLQERTQMLEDNLLMNTYILKACHQNQIQKFIGILSTCIFPDAGPFPLKIENLHNGPPHSSNEPYAMSKRMLEIHCRAYRDQYGHDYQCLVPTNLFGLYDNYHLEDSHVMPALLHKGYLAKLNKTQWKIKGTGKARRQFVHARDLARVILLGICEDKDSKFWEKGAVCVAPEDEYSIREVVGIMGEGLGFSESEVEWESEYEDGQIQKHADGSWIQEVYPWFQFQTFKEDINEWIEQFSVAWPNVRM